MSEYQYYEFLAIDRSLTADQIAQVRKYSARADISPTRFVNIYDYGNFRGDPEFFLQEFFDVFVYVANWGTHRLMFNVPVGLVDSEAIKRYSSGLLTVKESGEHLLIDIDDESVPGDDWVDGEGWMDPLSMIRREVLDEDYRALYLVWLRVLMDLRPFSHEPPVPPGLGSLTPAHRSLMEFLGIDPDLVEAAAEASPPMPKMSTDDLRSWIASLSSSEKDGVIEKMMTESDPLIIGQLRQQYRNSQRRSAVAPRAPRTVADLLNAAKNHREARNRAEAERKAAKERRRAAEDAKYHAAFLKLLAGRQEQTWREINVLLEDAKGTSNTEAVKLLAGLKEIAAQSGPAAVSEFQRRFNPFRVKYKKRRGLMLLMNEAGL